MSIEHTVNPTVPGKQLITTAIYKYSDFMYTGIYNIFNLCLQKQLTTGTIYKYIIYIYSFFYLFICTGIHIIFILYL